MKTCCLVWEIPVIEGEHYNPIINVIYMQKAKKFLNQLNRYYLDFAEYNEGKLDKIAIFFMNLKNNV